mgnify:FL=1
MDARPSPPAVWQSYNDPECFRSFKKRVSVPGRDEKAKERSGKVTPRDLARAAELSWFWYGGREWSWPCSCKSIITVLLECEGCR